MKKKYYLLKITLLDVKPEIWREFVVPSDITLDRLHDVIQIIMGWHDFHIHEFKIGKNRFSEFIDMEEQKDILFSPEFRLNEFLKRKGSKFIYLYDFGDLWEHSVVVKDSNYKRESDLEVYCVDGQRACPPEDIGGISGYNRLVETINNPASEDFESIMGLIENGYDSEAYDVKIVNWLLMKYYLWSRDRFLDWSEDFERDYEGIEE